MLTTELNLSLAWGLSALGQSSEAISLIDELLAQVETNGNLLYTPELLRCKGSILLLLPEPNRDGAKACFRQALELSRRQGARAWELRAAIDLAKLVVAQGNPDEAYKLLRPVSGHFADGLCTADLKAAKSLLTTLGELSPLVCAHAHPTAKCQLSEVPTNPRLLPFTPNRDLQDRIADEKTSISERRVDAA